MNKRITLNGVPDEYEIGPSVVAANIDDNIIPMPSPDYYNMKEIINNKKLVYNRGVKNPQTQELYEFEKQLEYLGIPFATNELLLDIL